MPDAETSQPSLTHLLYMFVQLFTHAHNQKLVTTLCIPMVLRADALHAVSDKSLVECRLQHNRLITTMDIIIKRTIQHQRGTAHMDQCNMGRRLSLSMWAGGDLSPQLQPCRLWKGRFSGSLSQHSSSLPVRHERRCLASSSSTGMARCGVFHYAQTQSLCLQHE